MGEIIAAQQRENLTHGICSLDGHQRFALLGDRRMDAYGDMDFRPVEYGFEFFEFTNRRNSYAFRAPCQAPRSGEDIYGVEYGAEVVGRLSHAHEDDVGQVGGFGNRKYLVDDGGCGEIAVKSLPSGHAERAVHPASGLR